MKTISKFEKISPNFDVRSTRSTSVKKDKKLLTVFFPHLISIDIYKINRMLPVLELFFWKKTKISISAHCESIEVILYPFLFSGFCSISKRKSFICFDGRTQPIFQQGVWSLTKIGKGPKIYSKFAFSKSPPTGEKEALKSICFELLIMIS